MNEKHMDATSLVATQSWKRGEGGMLNQMHHPGVKTVLESTFGPVL